MSRFDRQTILPDFGIQGQEKLSGAKVLVVGAGGLGCPALLHIAAAGVGTIGIADGDTISESNLNRQTLYGQADVGKPKAQTAASVLQQKYPDVAFRIIPQFLTPENALEVISEYDLVLDGTDNFGTRYMINDACFLLGKPLIMGAIYQYEGQLAVFNYGEDPINYRDVYPNPPSSNEIPNCSETGVLGVLPGLIGTLQATEAIKLLSGVGTVLSNKILFYNLKTTSFFEIKAEANPEARKKIPVSKEAFKAANYEINCGVAESISWEKAFDWTRNLKNSVLIDIRELNEEPGVENSEIEKIPMSVLVKDQTQIATFENILLFCKSGARSQKMAEELKIQFPEKNIFSVEGGILHPSSPLKKENHGA
ncbi:HesA/MoeB/ThiF family protein [Autumnicola psychrophila]|uniref:HesA/MoeB/ThiF family protein n=1 Tax=Autumnicola psychrophila TaxID=3075592 RepID=A0ABU3DSC3_9FLAO|nr:HesA/MoeB/ThiF family protein [Zunongwangia sp. F225]MDT0686610.1 HesA/MoeB/ThiF family protein [Zunongwangia sp. F225]